MPWVGGLNSAASASGSPLPPGQTVPVSLADSTLSEYETVAAGQTAQVFGDAGAAGDLVVGVLIVPATVSPGNVLLIDGSTSITVFAGGTNSVTSLIPFFVPLGVKSLTGPWKLTTGADVSAIFVGKAT